jgi:hypothetical protein
MSYETPSEYFKRSPGKTLADYYQHRKKIDSSLGEEKKLNTENFSRIHTQSNMNTQASKSELSKSAKIQITLSSLGIICFFLPWLHERNSFFSDHGLSITDTRLSITGYDLELLIFPLVFLVNALLITYRKSELLFLRNILLAIPLVWLIVRLYQIIDIVGGIENFKSAVSMILNYSSMLGVSISFGVGFYGTLICYLLLPFISSGLKDS